jgi:sortase A
MVFMVGAALFVGSGLFYWEGLSAVEEGGRKREVRLELVEAAVGEEIGRVYFPKLELGVPIFHGVSEDELVRGVGHVPESGLPGDGRNIVLSGHRDTVFRRLGELEVGDQVLVDTVDGGFLYKIVKVRVVDKDDTTVLVERPREVLTITTCYPFRFVGSAPERYVLEAVRLKRE